MISISYQKRTKIIYVVFEGKINRSELFDSVDGLNTNSKYIKTDAKIIYDFRKAKFDFVEHLMAMEIHQLRDYVSSTIQNYSKVDQALVVDDVSNEGLHMFYKEISKTIENYTFKIFDNIEAAENWLADI